jgi:methionine-rich copper-binding protein CopC
MKTFGFPLGFALLVSSALALAHAHLQKALPADGSVITAAPPNVVLAFSEPARLTALWIQKAAAQKLKLAPLPTEPAREISVALPHLTPGSYVVSWKVVGADGHVVPGQIRFTLSSGAASDHPANP